MLPAVCHQLLVCLALALLPLAEVQVHCPVGAATLEDALPFQHCAAVLRAAKDHLERLGPTCSGQRHHVDVAQPGAPRHVQVLEGVVHQGDVRARLGVHHQMVPPQL
jgi:hypothetical protein